MTPGQVLRQAYAEQGVELTNDQATHYLNAAIREIGARAEELGIKPPKPETIANDTAFMLRTYGLERVRQMFKAALGG